MAEKEEVTALLLQHGGKYSPAGAVEKGKLQDITELIKDGVDVNPHSAVSRACVHVRILCLCCGCGAGAGACGRVCVEREREEEEETAGS
jgi:hypothetical protein